MISRAKTQKLQKTFAAVALAAVLLLPVLAWAATTLSSLVSEFRNLINQIVALITGLAVMVFLWGVLRYISAGADSKKVEEARNFIIFGIIGLFVMFSVWGLVNLLSSSFTLDNTNKPVAPTL